ncbi:small G protein family protein / RhoGAP family protein isoform X2 [Wolffia australiana]
MHSSVSPRWRQKANGFFTSSGVKLKQASQSAGTFAKDAGESVAEAAERVGSIVKGRWALLQENKQRLSSPSRETLQEQILSAATVTTSLLKKGIAETKDVVAMGKVKVEEAAKITSDKSKTLLSNIERWQKGVASTDVFGVPIEVVLQRQHSDRPIPQILVRCADYLVLSGLHTENLFKQEGNRKAVRQLISLYNQDSNATLPEGSKPLDVASLIKCYLSSLPEPLTTFEMYHDIREARSNINDVRNLLSKLPNVNYSTLEYITALLLRVSQKSSLNKMDSCSLAVELAPLMIWQRGDSKSDFHGHLSYISSGPSKTVDLVESTHAAANTDEAADVSTLIPLDDGATPDYGVIEVVQCLIDHHNAIFTDANETVWR